MCEELISTYVRGQLLAIHFINQANIKPLLAFSHFTICVTSQSFEHNIKQRNNFTVAHTRRPIYLGQMKRNKFIHTSIYIPIYILYMCECV